MYSTRSTPSSLEQPRRFNRYLVFAFLLFYPFLLFGFLNHNGGNSKPSPNSPQEAGKIEKLKANQQRKTDAVANSKGLKLKENVPSTDDDNNNNNDVEDVSSWADRKWWIDEKADDFFERLYITDRKKYNHLNSLEKNKDFFNPVCGRYRFDISGMPKTSVIVTVQNEVSGMLSVTVQSILARTPPELLQEIIIVDDNGMSPSLRGNDEPVDEKEFIDLKKLSSKVVLIKNKEREGCARSRLIGADSAKGEVLIFVDSHIEMESSTWLQHLLVPILENPRTLSMQLIDIMSDLGDHTDYSTSPEQFGVVNDKFFFAYEKDRFADFGFSEVASNRLPYETPFGPGSLFAIRRDEFYRLGGYDKGLYVWGGENTELALKVWTCGGRVVMVPCSRVAHMYRVHIKETGRWPPKLPQELLDKLGLGHEGEWKLRNAPSDDFTKITTRNNLRVMNLWIGDHPAKEKFYKKNFDSAELPPEWQQFIDEMENDPYWLEQKKIKEENQCEDFEWFDRHVYMKLAGRHHPWHPLSIQRVFDENGVNCGAHTAKSCRLCPQGHGSSWCNGDCVWQGSDQAGTCVLRENAK